MLLMGFGVLIVCITSILGRRAFVVMLCQQLMVIAFTQVMSYVLHYGLVRERDLSGR